MIYLNQVKYLYKEKSMLLLETLANYLATKGVKKYERFKVYFENKLHICELTETEFWEYQNGVKKPNEDLGYLILTNNVYIEKD